METIENLDQYHDFIGNSMAQLVQAVANKANDGARRLAKFNLEYAFCLWKTEEQEEF